jgi:hypothetical protein
VLPRRGVALVVCSLCLSARADEKKPVPVYTNADLERVRPYRDDTGVASRPAVASVPTAEAESRPTGRGEAYWRREAARVRQRLEALAEQEEARRQRPGVRSFTDPQVVRWQARIQGLQARRRALEEALLDRARRDGALPGWLR